MKKHEDMKGPKAPIPPRARLELQLQLIENAPQFEAGARL